MVDPKKIIKGVKAVKKAKKKKKHLSKKCIRFVVQEIKEKKN